VPRKDAEKVRLSLACSSKEGNRALFQTLQGHTHPRARLRAIKTDDRRRARLMASLSAHLARFHPSLWRASAMHYSYHLLATTEYAAESFSSQTSA